MSTWHYAFLFPASEEQLDPAGVVASLAKSGYELNSTGRVLVPVDDKGHLGEYGDEVTFKEPFTEDLQTRLQFGEQLFAEFSKFDSDTDIVTTFACSFAVKTVNPHISVGWHKRLFSQLPTEIQHDRWMAIRDAAKSSNSAYVVLAVEASDSFEDRFLEVDGKRILDTESHHQYGHGIWAVWVDHTHDSECPVGVIDKVAADIGSGFVQYDVA